MARIRITPQAKKSDKHPAMQIQLQEVSRFTFQRGPMSRTALKVAEAIGQAHRVQSQNGGTHR